MGLCIFANGVVLLFLNFAVDDQLLLGTYVKKHAKIDERKPTEMTSNFVGQF